MLAVKQLKVLKKKNKEFMQTAKKNSGYYFTILRLRKPTTNYESNCIHHIISGILVSGFC